MSHPGNPWLVTGAALSAMAVLLHVGAVVFGAAWYRFLGAGEQMARMAATGRLYPTVVTLAIAAVLLVWSLYALSGAGVIGRLPLLRAVLCAITAIYLLRAVAFLPLMTMIPGNSLTFWLVSSSICLVFGVVHLVGLLQVWDHL